MHRRSIHPAALVCVIVPLFSIPQAAADDLFRTRVVPILQHRCLSCHNSLDHKGGFAVQTREELLGGGFVEPGAPGDSHLLAVITPQGNRPPAMPKNGTPLKVEEVAVLREWIAGGATWPDEFRIDDPVVDSFDWWSLRPLVRPPVPEFAAGTEASHWIQTPVDAFILKAMNERQLAPSLQADRRTLIRRLSFDLTGLPPDPDDVAEFVNELDPLAWQKLTDRLLHSPHYGERWGRHWLDVVRYADTCGYDKDKLRPNAWPYRDYVVNAFNHDKPYARFVQEQIAGDVLFPGSPDGILGLGFIAAGPWDFIGHVEVPESKIDGRIARHTDRDEMAASTLNTFCSVTIQCCQCHNHKFDPFTQQHYYNLQSVFAAVDRADRPYDLDPGVELRRRQLTDELKTLAASRKTIDDEIHLEGGTKLARLEKLIAELKPLAQPRSKQPEYGWHSAIAPQADTEKWVEVDLGRDVAIERILLRPCHDEFANIGAGFGFPTRFQVSVRTTPEPAAESTTLLSDRSESDVPNPGLAPVEIAAAGMMGRYIRVTATRLAERSSDWIFALAELEILDSDGRNLALHADVRSLDSIEAPVRWSRTNLTDGIWPQAVDGESVRKLASAVTQHADLVARLNTPERQKRKDELDQKLRAAEAEQNALPKGRMVYAAATHFDPQGNFHPTRGQPREVHVLHRGNILQPGERARPGTIPLTEGSVPEFPLPGGAGEGDRRAALAHWLTSPEHPLTWRSIANRLWQYHFGVGLVESPNDFGRMGQLPTHPELLDWLAVEFRDSGGSFRHLHRLIVSSAVYQQSSAQVETHAAIDSANRYLWRMNRRRLEAEEVRDSILSVSGRLDKHMGGPGYYLFVLEKTAHSPHYEYHLFDPDDPASHRRSVFRFIVRSQPDPFMTTLDCADSSQSTPRRDETLTSLQALSLLNNRFNLTMARHFAERLEVEAGTTPEQVTLAMQLVAGRSPSDDELQILETYASQHGLPNLCRLLFNLSEFVFVD